MKKYRTIVIDPPWEYRSRPGWYQDPRLRKLTDFQRKNAEPAKNLAMPYPTMSIKEIQDLPIEDLANVNCALFLWTTQRYLEEAIEIVKKWGFNYSSMLVWTKKPRGIVGTFICSCEFIVYATKGSINPKRKQMGTSFNWIRRQHSEKPEEFQDMIETITHDPYLELFARRKRQGWDVWGNEVESDIKL
jgi:N6-adenosine-specific RNA methylase IME4